MAWRAQRSSSEERGHVSAALAARQPGAARAAAGRLARARQAQQAARRPAQALHCARGQPSIPTHRPP